MTRNNVPWQAPGPYEQWWLDQDGKEVTIDGYKHLIRSWWRPVWYPYPHYRLDVVAEPTLAARRTEWYRQTRRELGDDWFTDVLQSDNEVMGSIAEQLEFHL